jgi:hypothetical protein
MPLVIGVVAGGRPRAATAFLVLAALAGFLLRQPLTIAVKVLAGRRSKEVLPAALAAGCGYGAILSVAVAALALGGAGHVLYLALAALPVLIWYLELVRRSAERRALVLEVLASGVLTLSAPAGLWIGVGRYAPEGWLLWVLVWAFCTWSILFVYMRLIQRGWRQRPSRRELWDTARIPLALALLNLAGVILLATLGEVPLLLPLAYVVPLAETLRGTLVPAARAKPRAIGLRQLAVTALSLALFVLALLAGPPLAEPRQPEEPRAPSRSAPARRALSESETEAGARRTGTAAPSSARSILRSRATLAALDFPTRSVVVEPIDLLAVAPAGRRSTSPVGAIAASYPRPEAA